MAKKSNGKAKSAASPAEIEYVPMSEAKLHRRYKAKVVEECLTQIVQRDGAVTRESLLTAATGRTIRCTRTSNGTTVWPGTSTVWPRRRA